MNAKKRAKISESIVAMTKAIAVIESVKDAEEDALWNIPENLQSSDRYSEMESGVDSMNRALELFEQGIDALNEAV